MMLSNFPTPSVPNVSSNFDRLFRGILHHSPSVVHVSTFEHCLGLDVSGLVRVSTFELDFGLDLFGLAGCTNYM